MQRKIDQWDALSADCQLGLEIALGAKPGTDGDVAIALRVDALNRALKSADQLKDAANGSTIDWRMLGAIGLRETGFVNKKQSDGNGRGIFQIDVGENPAVSEQDATNPTWSAEWVVHYLEGNRDRFRAAYPSLTESGYGLMWAVAASYNHGFKGVLSNLNSNRNLDYHTTGGNYGQSVVLLQDCFE